MRRRWTPWGLAALALGAFFVAAPSAAHVLGRSMSELRPRPNEAATFDAVIELDPDDFGPTLQPRFDNDRSGMVESSELDRNAEVLAGIIAAGWALQRGGTPCTGEVLGQSQNRTLASLRVRVRYHCAASGPLSVELRLFDQLRRGHVHLLSVRRDGGMDGVVLTDTTRTWSEPIPETTLGSLGRFFVLGGEHILIGIDHLAFLLGLLLVATSLRQIAAIVTAFTVAHSITLGAAALGTINLPGHIVEPAIALTIIYVAAENLFATAHRRRWLLAFVLGLVHGFGFAGVLADLGLPAERRGVALFGFNVGVETGQLAVVAVLWPILRLCRRRFGTRVATVGSVAVGAAGILWLAQRLFWA